jgi:hypothetical protein
MKAWREAGDMCGLKVRCPQLSGDDGCLSVFAIEHGMEMIVAVRRS